MEGGAARLTLDAVAEKAGVSKGGVLYHFPTKEALHVGMIARLINHSYARRETTLQSLPETPSRAVKAELISLLLGRDSDDRVSAAMLAAIANEPQLMSTVREYNEKRFEGHKSPAEMFERKALLLLAADGLFLMELLQVSPFSHEQRKKLVDELLHMADNVS